MPPSRNNKATKQKKLIQAQLMRISLVIDNYVYKNKAISAQDAANYIEEIAGCKIKSIGDTRSLQVIEKLTRCMKTIINDQECNQMEVVSRPSDGNINDTQVYSLPDEDLTQATVNNTEVNDHNNFDMSLSVNMSSNNDILLENSAVKDIPVKQNTATNERNMSSYDRKTDNVNITKTIAPETDEINKQIDTLVLNNTCNEEIIDLCDDENGNNTKLSIDLDMQRALSNLSLQETEPMNTYFECSQSILENYSHNNTASVSESCIVHENNGHVKSNEIQVFKKPVARETSIKTRGMNQRNVPRKSGKFQTRGMNQRNVPRKSGKFQNVENKKNINNGKVKVPRKRKPKILENKGNAINNDGKIPRKRKPKTLETETNLKIDTTKTKKSTNNNNKHIHIDETSSLNKTATDHEISMNRVDTNDTAINQIKQYENNKRIKEVDKIKPQTLSFVEEKDLNMSIPKINEQKSNMIIAERNSITNKHPIYNTKVLDDLSWMENIRFVREIATEEYDPNLSCLEDTFWDNYVLPASFDDQDFTVY